MSSDPVFNAASTSVCGVPAQPYAELQNRKHKLKRLMQSPNSFFMDVKCQGCFNITTVFNHSQIVVLCGRCQNVCQPSGGKVRLTEGCSFRRKGD